MLDEARSMLRALRENIRMSLRLIYVDYADSSTAAFRKRFFPFCLSHSVPPLFLDDAPSQRQKNERLNVLSKNVIKAALNLRSSASVVAEQTNLPNLTPLLLPVRNFQAASLMHMLEHLYCDLAISAEPKALLRTEINKFLDAHPRVTPPGDNRHCFSDQRLFFKSPGKNRHGYYRNSADHQHGQTCLLNARSRLGGSFDHEFHFDCVACKGGLANHYPNCHGESVPPKTTHVNISPNDGIV